jgi:LemA protein
MLAAGAAAIALVVVVALFASYNRFVTQRQLIANSWSNVDTELQRRHDLVPNLVETVKGYAAHERTTLEAVTIARTRASLSADVRSAGPSAPPAASSERIGAEQSLSAGLRQLLALQEAYPSLAASFHFLELQQELVRTENRIQAARRFFNGNVRDYNRRVESFPSLVVAALFGFRRHEYFEIEPSVRDAGAPSVDLSR